MFTRAGVFAALSAALLTFGVRQNAAAQQTVKIGAIYPLSGNAASAGNYSKAAIELAVDLVNNGNPEPEGRAAGRREGPAGPRRRQDRGDLRRQPGHAGGGPEPGAAPDHRGEGASRSSAPTSRASRSPPAPWPSGTAFPFLTPESVAANLTERGFKWFFRATPVAGDFARAYSDFLKEQKAAGQKTDTIAVVHENTEYGNSVASVIKDEFAKDGHNISQMIPYSANTTDVQPQVLQLKEKNPDVVIFISYTSDAILYAKTMKDLNWKPSIMIADNAGFNDPSFVSTSGALVEGLINRSSFAVGKPGSVSAIDQRACTRRRPATTSTIPRRAPCRAC